MQHFRNMVQKISFRSDTTISSCACVLLDANKTIFYFAGV